MGVVIGHHVGFEDAQFILASAVFFCSVSRLEPDEDIYMNWSNKGEYHLDIPKNKISLIKYKGLVPISI